MTQALECLWGLKANTEAHACSILSEDANVFVAVNATSAIY